MTHIIRASETGAKLDSNIYTGCGTDDTEVLQKALDLAKDGGVHLIMDGAALVRGLKIHSNTTIECLNKDCGFFLADGSDEAILKNADQDMGSIKNRNIKIIGGTYNGNCNNQSHHINAPEDDMVFTDKNALWPLKGLRFVCGFLFAGVENLEIEGVTMRDCRTFAITIGCFEHVVLENIWVDIPNHILEGNQDGIHIWGEGRFLTMRNIRGFSGDDFIALNTDEFDGKGSLTDVLIDGVVIDGATRVIRLLSRDKGRLDRITIKNVSGTYRGYGCFIETHFPDSTTGGNIGNVVFDNFDLRPLKAMSDIDSPVGERIAPFLFNIRVNCEHLTFRNIYNHMPETQRELFQFEYDVNRASKVKKVTIDGLYLVQDAKMDFSPISVNLPIECLALKNVDIVCASDTKVPFIHFGEDGHIGTLLVNGFASNGIKCLKDKNAVDKEILWNVSVSES